MKGDGQLERNHPKILGRPRLTPGIANTPAAPDASLDRMISAALARGTRDGAHQAAADVLARCNPFARGPRRLVNCRGFCAGPKGK